MAALAFSFEFVALAVESDATFSCFGLRCSFTAVSTLVGSAVLKKNSFRHPLSRARWDFGDLCYLGDWLSNRYDRKGRRREGKIELTFGERICLETAHDCLRIMSRSSPQGALLVLRAIANGWPTAHRLHFAECRECIFGV